MPFEVQKTFPDSTVWVDPADLGTTVRLKQSNSPKSLSGRSVANYRNEIIVLSSHPFVLDGVNVTDSLSMRLSLSGSAHSRAELQALVDLLIGSLKTWDLNKVLAGFTPDAAPIKESLMV